MTELKKQMIALEMADYILYKSCNKHFTDSATAKKAFIKIKCMSHRLQTFDERCTFILIVANHFSALDFTELKEMGFPNSVLESFYVVRVFYKKGNTVSLLKYIYSRPSVNNVIKLFSKEFIFLGNPITCNVVEDDIGFTLLSPQNESIFSEMARYYSKDLRKYQPDGFYKNYNSHHAFAELNTYCFVLDDEIIGFCNIMSNYNGSTHNCNYHIEDFYIKDCYANIGIGTLCAKKVLKMLSGKCSLDILENNLKARHFWNKVFTKYCYNVHCVKEIDGLYNYIFIPVVK